MIAILIYEAARGRWREWLRLRWGWGLLVFLAVALPWFIAVSMRNPDFPRYAFWNESLKRFSTGAAHRGGGIFYYIPVFLGGFFPWSLFLLLAGWNRLRRWRELKQEAGRPILFLLCWAAWVFVFFTLSHSKLPTYFLPAIVPLSILMGLVWQDVGKEAQARPPDWLTAGFALLLGLGVVVAAASQSWLYRRASGAAGQETSTQCVGTHQAVVALHRVDPCSAGISRPEAGGTGCVGGRWRSPHLCWRPWLSRRLCCAGMRRLRLLAEDRFQPPPGGHHPCQPGAGFARFSAIIIFAPACLSICGAPWDCSPIEWGEMTSNYQVAHQAEARRAAGGQSGQRIAGHAPGISRPDEIKLAAHSGDDPEPLGGRPLGECGAHRPALE